MLRQSITIVNRCLTNVVRQQSNKTEKKKMAQGAFVLLVVPITTFGLGTWQVYRWRWKLALIDHLAARVHHPPIDLPDDLDEIKQLEYRQVKVRGIFDHSKELTIAPRSLIETAGAPRGLMRGSSSSYIGAHVITPFHLSDRNVTVLVNRGFVPRAKVDPEERQEGQIQGEVEVVGILRNTEPRAPFVSDNKPESRRWFRRDVEALAANLDTSPVFIDANAGTSVPGGPVGGQTSVAVRNEHVNYFITWYSLSAATAFMWYTRFIRRL